MFVDGDEPIAVGAEDNRLAFTKVLVALGSGDSGGDVVGETAPPGNGCASWFDDSHARTRQPSDVHCRHSRS